MKVSLKQLKEEAKFAFSLGQLKNYGIHASISTAGNVIFALASPLDPGWTLAIGVGATALGAVSAELFQAVRKRLVNPEAELHILDIVIDLASWITPAVYVQRLL